MVEGTRPSLTLPEAAHTGDHCNKATPGETPLKSQKHKTFRGLRLTSGGVKVRRRSTPEGEPKDRDCEQRIKPLLCLGRALAVEGLKADPCTTLGQERRSFRSYGDPGA